MLLSRNEVTLSFSFSKTIILLNTVLMMKYKNEKRLVFFVKLLLEISSFSNSSCILVKYILELSMGYFLSFMKAINSSERHFSYK